MGEWEETMGGVVGEGLHTVVLYLAPSVPHRALARSAVMSLLARGARGHCSLWRSKLAPSKAVLITENL